MEKSEYLKCLGKIFGIRTKDGGFSQYKEINEDFFIPNLAEYKQRYSQIYDRFNIDRYINPTYIFEAFEDENHLLSSIVRKENEPEWSINTELKEKIFGEMPDNFSVEEKALYIYCKLCKELSYDYGFSYRNKLDDDRYTSLASKEHLEGIKPKSKVTCWDFARICSKMIDSLNGAIHSEVISQSLINGHFLVGFYTDNVSTMLEAINVNDNGTNDLTKAKSGIKLEGINIVSDKKEIINKALDKIYPLIYGDKGKDINEYIQNLKALPREEIPNDIEKKLQSFVETMKKYNIKGNEAIQNLILFNNSGYFGEKLDKVFIGKKEINNGRKNFRREVLIRKKGKTPKEKNIYYLLDSYSLEISVCNPQEIKEKFKTGEYVYEDENYKMDELEER